MQISEIPSSLPSPEFLLDWTRWTAGTPWGLVAVQAQKVSDTLTNTNQVPSEALIILWGYQIISQEWLSKQLPLAGFFEDGQSLNPSLKQTDDTKRQCWEDNGVYRCNQIGSEWILEQLGARVLNYDEIISIYENAQGRNNTEKMKNMWVVALGWRYADDGRVENVGIAYLRSRSPDGNGGMLTAKLLPDRSDVDLHWFRPRIGIVPFGVMDKKVPA